jgi:hypothetical protein
MLNGPGFLAGRMSLSGAVKYCVVLQIPINNPKSTTEKPMARCAHRGYQSFPKPARCARFDKVICKMIVRPYSFDQQGRNEVSLLIRSSDEHRYPGAERNHRGH